jgi:hypothetical protein
MTDQAIFNADPNANKDLVVELVGEGKTYKTVDELAKGKINADIHIKRLEEEAKALREQLAGAKSVEDVLEAVKANSVSRQAELKDILLDTLQGQKYVNWMSNFPDGNTFHIPSIGEIPMRTASENNPVVYDTMDTGEFTFTIDKYPEAAIYITDKAKQDMYLLQSACSVLPSEDASCY